MQLTDELTKESKAKREEKTQDKKLVDKCQKCIEKEKSEESIASGWKAQIDICQSNLTKLNSTLMEKNNEVK